MIAAGILSSAIQELFKRDSAVKVLVRCGEFDPLRSGDIFRSERGIVLYDSFGQGKRFSLNALDTNVASYGMVGCSGGM
ncbi:MAG: hypothetical protein AAFX54_16065 [Pseudomonadota bacterium]